MTETVRGTEVLPSGIAMVPAMVVSRGLRPGAAKTLA
jgi:hypothetical protein